MPGSDQRAMMSSRQASSIDRVCWSSFEIVELKDAFLARPFHTEPPRIEMWEIVSDFESSSTTDIDRRVVARSTERHLLRVISTWRKGASRIRNSPTCGKTGGRTCAGERVGDVRGVPSSSTMKLTARIRLR